MTTNMEEVARNFQDGGIVRVLQKEAIDKNTKEEVTVRITKGGVKGQIGA